MSLHTPQIPHELVWDGTRASEANDRQTVPKNPSSHVFIYYFNPALRPVSVCENESISRIKKTKAQSRVMVELIRTDGLQSLYTLAHWLYM
jgi:hypothetical protein